MEKTGSLNIVIPLHHATDCRACGTKASTVANLLKLGFAVPDGFCLGANAYRAHLWAAGVRTLARAKPGASDREALRRAILDHDLPDDVFSALQSAYASLGADAVVAVRHSASGEDTAGKAYTTVLGVSSLPALVEAVKSIWASLWSEEAAELRERLPGRAEPAMAMLVQTLVDAHVSGVAVAANPTTGSPNEVHIRSTWGVYAGSAATDHAAVDLLDFRIMETHVGRKETILRVSPGGLRPESTPPELVEAPSLTLDQITQLAEVAVWIDTSLGGTRITQWVYDGERFLILGAWPAGRLRPYFPVSWPNRREGLLVWRLLSPEPEPGLIHSLPIFRKRSVLSLPSAKGKIAIRSQNGRTYRRVIHPWEAKGRLAAALDVIAGAGLHSQWKRAADRILRECWKRPALPVQKLSYRALISSIRRAFLRAELSAEWLEAFSYPVLRFPHLLREMLMSIGAPPELFPQLFMGHDPVWLERDRAFQRLAAYAWQAREDVETTDAPEEIAPDLAKRLGYVFGSARDTYSPASWRSWAENPDRVLEIAQALARGPLTDVELAQGSAIAVARTAEQAALEAIRASRGWFKRPLARLKFRLLLRRARTAIAAASAAEQVHALALSMLRINVLELGRRLEDSETLTAADDIFHLSFREIMRLRAHMSEADRESLGRLLARRKHKMWLQQRLCPPEWLPLGAGPHCPEAPPLKGATLSGIPASPGQVVGPARVARSIDDAISLQPGEILVVEDIGPAWTPLLGLAAGLVLSRGDLLSCGAIAARNYGIPCVCEVSRATSAVDARQTVRVDGTAATVEIVRRRSARQ